MVDASILEEQKENIQPLLGGRSASKLAESSSVSSSTIALQRAKHEAQLQNLDELDDPLQAYCDYVEWTHTAFPQGSNSASGLLSLLERCTSEFRDIPHYKNDPRYLKVWLEYKDYSDSPRDIFIYLAKKEIGKQLALYYEQFAEFLEANRDFEEANEVYEIGISIQARPLPRLQRSYKNFKERTSLQDNRTTTHTRRGLSVREGDHEVQRGEQQESAPAPKRQRVEVFNESEDKNVLRSIFNSVASTSSPSSSSTKNNVDLGTIALRTKENTMSAKPWAGEVLRQKIVVPKSSGAKIPVYRDENTITSSAESSIEKPPYHVEQEYPGGPAYSSIAMEGKKPERLDMNLNLLYTEDREYCLDELVAIKRLARQGARSMPSFDQSTHTTSNSILIPLKDEDDDTTLPSRQRPNSPTMTLYSRMASNEVLGMFNNAAHKVEDEDEGDVHNEEGKNESTNYDGFETETIHLEDDPRTMAGEYNGVEIQNTEGNQEQDLLPSQPTPPTDQYDTTHSSPFIERPTREPASSLSSSSSLAMNSYATYDPSDDVLREALLNKSCNLNQLIGYHDSSSNGISNIKKFQEVTNSVTKIIPKGFTINYCGDNHLCLRYELGKGGYGTVYLVETEMGEFKALKVESPATNWEFYILSQIRRRLSISNYDMEIQRMIVKPESLFLFKNESYLILNYINQGTILDVVNYYKNLGSIFDETMIIWFTIKLLKIIEVLHDVGIIHGDLKADNCMVRLPKNPEGDGITTEGGITLIDFGRAIDLTLFGNNTKPRFISHWESDQQDCPQMNNGQPWSYEADYYGIAGIIHTMLYGKYIEVQLQEDSRYSLKNGMKRYWQTHLWEPLFELLLNPGHDITKLPISNKLREHRKQMEEWLQGETTRTRKLREKIHELKTEFDDSNKKLLRSLQ